MTRRADDPPVDVGQRFSLQAEALVDGVSLAQDAVDHVMTVVDTAALVEHVVRLSSFGVVGSVGVNVGANVREEVRAVAGVGNERPDAGQFPTVVKQNLTMSREVVLFQGRRREGGLGVEQPGKLSDDRLSLEEKQVSMRCCSSREKMGKQRAFEVVQRCLPFGGCLAVAPPPAVPPRWVSVAS